MRVPRSVAATTCGFRSRVTHASTATFGRAGSANASAEVAANRTGPNCAFAIALNAGCDHSTMTRSGGPIRGVDHARAMSAAAAIRRTSDIASHSASAGGSGGSEKGIIAAAVQRG